MSEFVVVNRALSSSSLKYCISCGSYRNQPCRKQTPNAVIKIHIITDSKPRSVYNREEAILFDRCVVVDGEIDVFAVSVGEVLGCDITVDVLVIAG